MIWIVCTPVWALYREHIFENVTTGETSQRMNVYFQRYVPPAVPFLLREFYSQDEGVSQIRLIQQRALIVHPKTSD
jgi:hypothetical protein